jgi:hypothetical protein
MTLEPAPAPGDEAPRRKMPTLAQWFVRNGRVLAAGFIVTIAVLSACVVVVAPGEAIVMGGLENSRAH